MFQSKIKIYEAPKYNTIKIYEAKIDIIKSENVQFCSNS